MLSSLFYLFFAAKQCEQNVKSVRIYIYYILGMLAGFLYSVPVYSATTTSEHLTNLQILIDNNLPYTQNITADSIIYGKKSLNHNWKKTSNTALFSI